MFEDEIRIHEWNVRLIFWAFRQNHGHCEEWACPGIQMTHCSLRHSCNWGICALLHTYWWRSLLNNIYVLFTMYLTPLKQIKLFQTLKHLSSSNLNFRLRKFLFFCWGVVMYAFARFGFWLRMTALYVVAVRIEGLDLKFADLTIPTFYCWVVSLDTSVINNVAWKLHLLILKGVR